MSALKETSIEISRICSDLRLLSSWPYTWIWEVNLPPVQPWSSIMPWKINPSILESVNMICYHIIWAETSVSHCCIWWQLNLNVNMPLMTYELISSTKKLTHWLAMMRKKCVEWISINADVCKKHALESSSLATILNPLLWYSQVAALVKKQLLSWKPIIEIILEEGIMEESELHRLLEDEIS
jgi:aspartate ammonia-lyase